MSYFPRGYSHPEGDDAFNEYDPHPYNGGCNLTFAYGRPLPPSEDTCHPATPLIISSELPAGQKDEKKKHGLSSLTQLLHPKDKDGGDKSDDEDEEKKKHHHKHHFQRKHYDD